MHSLAMNLKVLIILFVIITLTTPKIASALLRSFDTNVKSDEDDIERVDAQKVLPVIRPSSTVDFNLKALPNTATSSNAAIVTLRPYNGDDKPAASLIDVVVLNSTASAHAYIADSSQETQDSSSGDGNVFIPLERHNGTESVRNHSAKHAKYCEPEVFEHDYLIVENRTHSNTNYWKRAHIGERAGLREVCLKPNGLPLTRLCRYNAQRRSAEWEDIRNWTRIICMRQTRECILSDKLNALHERLLENRQLLGDVHKRGQVTSQLYGMLKEINFKLLPADVHLASQILQEVSTAAKDTELSVDVVRICDRLMSSDHQVLRISADLNSTNSILDTFEQYMDELAARQVPTTSCASKLTTTIVSRPSVGAAATDNVASSYARAVEEIKMGYLGVRAHISTNISVFFVNPSCSNISGIAVYAPLPTQHLSVANGPTAMQGLTASASSSHVRTTHSLFNAAVANFRYRFIYMNESVSAITQEDGLQVAGFLPESLWQHVRSALLAKGKEPVIVFKVYGHDALFVDPSLVQTKKPFSKILSISIPGYTEQFPEPLSFLLRNRYEYMDPSLIAQAGTGCGYWNYSTWVNNGVKTDIKDMLKQTIIECRTQHLTQFSFLLGGTYRQNDFSDEVLITPIHLRALDIISLIGCSLSLLGLLGIWITGLLFKSWRSLASTKVLLNLCVALTLQMVIFLFINTKDMSAELVEDRLYINCILLGAFMQYSILVLFAWMLIIAVLQFQRYVTVIGIERPKHYIFKSAILAWGLPLLPTILLACMDPKSFIPSEYELQTNSGICYPSGLGLTLGVVLPVTSVVIANFTIFIYVFYSISHTLNQAMHRSEKKMIVKQIRLSVLLFFLLGISWIFGLFAYMQAGIIFSYIFCLTATLQGFVLFIYFVLLDEAPRNAWLTLINPQRKKKTDKRTKELQSMTTTTALESGGCSRETFNREHRVEKGNGNTPHQVKGEEQKITR
ncbi:adhesion G-protein coupled receptor G7 [Eurosta solidaginis]|uniref:adhesion G-protein coupled receptor G7 n=1 Tax=Eurosta solidaginis TaxID=178769 RepID=UPI0035305FAA